MEEIWKDIEGYRGYQVSNKGRVRTHNKVTFTEHHGRRVWKDRVLKQKLDRKSNTFKVELWRDGMHKTILVHRLVANAFIENLIDSDLTVNHKDGNRLNNCAENLEWMTLGDNIRDGYEKGLYHCRKACILTDSNDKEYHFKSLSEASVFLNRSHGYVGQNISHDRPLKNKAGEVFTVSF